MVFSHLTGTCFLNSYLATTAMATATAPAPYDAGERDADKMEGIFFATVEYFHMQRIK